MLFKKQRDREEVGGWGERGREGDRQTEADRKCLQPPRVNWLKKIIKMP